MPIGLKIIYNKMTIQDRIHLVEHSLYRVKIELRNNNRVDKEEKDLLIKRMGDLESELINKDWGL